MKKAEAISILATSVRPREAKDRARYDEAVKMAIEALKCSETSKSSERTSETAQADHTADIGKKVSIPCAHENDLISRQAALKKLAVYIHLIDKTMGKGTLTDDDCMEAAKSVLGEDELPAVQPVNMVDAHAKNTPNSTSLGEKERKPDLISRQAAIDALKGLPTWWADEGGYYGGVQPPMVALLDPEDAVSAIENLPSAQPATNCSEIPNDSDDTISRQAAIDALARMMPRSYTPDGSHPADEEIFRAQEVFVDCIEALEILPSAAPSTAHTTETTAETTAPSTDDWIPVKKRLPAVPVCRCLITRDDGRGRVTEEALFSFSRWYDNEHLEDGCNRKFDISASVIAWAPFPAPYQGGDT